MAQISVGATPEPPPQIRRVYAQPIVLVIALAMAVVLIYAIDLWAPDTAAVVLIDENRPTYPFTVQNAMWLVFAVGLGELLLRFLDARGEKLELAARYSEELEYGFQMCSSGMTIHRMM